MLDSKASGACFKAHRNFCPRIFWWTRKLTLTHTLLQKIKYQTSHANYTEKRFYLFFRFEKKGFGVNLEHWGKKLLGLINPTQSATIEGTHAAYVLKQLFNTS